jgi:hypothetical protein
MLSAQRFHSLTHALQQDSVEIQRNLFYQSTNLGQILLPVFADRQYRFHQVAGADLMVAVLAQSC